MDFRKGLMSALSFLNITEKLKFGYLGPGNVWSLLFVRYLMLRTQYGNNDTIL